MGKGRLVQNKVRRKSPQENVSGAHIEMEARAIPKGLHGVQSYNGGITRVILSDNDGGW
jgi:predicted small secreted protein